MGILGVSDGQFVAALLLFTRVACMFLFAPVWNTPILPMRIKAVAALALTLSLVVSGAAGQIAPPANAFLLAAMVAREVCVGMLVGFVAQLVFAAVQLGGEVVGGEMGYSMAAMMDPQLGSTVSPVTRIYFYVALLFYLAVGGDRLFIEAMVGNLSRLPLGDIRITGTLIQALVALTGEVYTLGIQLVAPVMVAMLCTGVLLGILARSVPQMNMLMLGYSLKIIVGLVVMGLMLPKWADTFLAALARSFEAVRGLGPLIR